MARSVCHREALAFPTFRAINVTENINRVDFSAQARKGKYRLCQPVGTGCGLDMLC